MKATFKGDYAFGTENEGKVHSHLETFLDTKLHRRGGYSTFDFDNGSTIFVELKSRRISHDKYETTLVGSNKVKQARENPDKIYWFCFSFEDGLYGIQYNEELFNTFEIKSYVRGYRADHYNPVQQCCFIPTHKLVKIH